MKGGPFATNLRGLQRKLSDGGAGQDHADEMMALEESKMNTIHDWRPKRDWRAECLVVAAACLLVAVVAASLWFAR